MLSLPTQNLMRLLAKQVLQQLSGADMLQHTRAAGLSVALGHLACNSCTVMSPVALLYQEARAWFFHNHSNYTFWQMVVCLTGCLFPLFLMAHETSQIWYDILVSNFQCLNIKHAYRDAQIKPAWRNKTCAAHT